MGKLVGAFTGLFVAIESGICKARHTRGEAHVVDIKHGEPHPVIVMSDGVKFATPPEDVPAFQTAMEAQEPAPYLIDKFARLSNGLRLGVYAKPVE